MEGEVDISDRDTVTDLFSSPIHIARVFRKSGSVESGDSQNIP